MVLDHRILSEKSYLLGAHKVTLRQHQVIWPRREESAAGAGGDRNSGSQGDTDSPHTGPQGPCQQHKSDGSTPPSTLLLKVALQFFPSP